MASNPELSSGVWTVLPDDANELMIGTISHVNIDLRHLSTMTNDDTVAMPGDLLLWIDQQADRVGISRAEFAERILRKAQQVHSDITEYREWTA